METQKDEAIKRAKLLKHELGQSGNVGIVEFYRRAVMFMENQLIEKDAVIEKNNHVIAINGAKIEDNKKRIQEEMWKKVKVLEDAFDEKVEENNEVIKNQKESIDKMRISRTETSEEHKELVKKINQKMKDTETACRRYEANTTHLTAELHQTKETLQLVEKSLKMQTNWIDTFLFEHSKMISEVWVTNQKMAVQSKQSEDQLEVLKKKKDVLKAKQAAQELELENLRLRLRDVESLGELF